MLIHSGRNVRGLGRFGRLMMGYYDRSNLPLTEVARRYAMADHFFMGAFGGLFLNHQYLIYACAP